MTTKNRIKNGDAVAAHEERELELSEQQADLLLQHHNEMLFAQQKLNAALGMVLASHGIKSAELLRMTKRTLTVRVIE